MNDNVIFVCRSYIRIDDDSFSFVTYVKYIGFLLCRLPSYNYCRKTNYMENFLHSFKVHDSNWFNMSDKLAKRSSNLYLLK